MRKKKTKHKGFAKILNYLLELLFDYHDKFNLERTLKSVLLKLRKLFLTIMYRFL